MTTPILILLILITPLVTAFLVTRGRRHTRLNPPNWSRYAAWGLGAAFVFFSLGHFVRTGGMVTMLPPWVPLRTTLVYATGFIELGIALALFAPNWQRAGAWAAIAVFVLFFPANLYAAINGVGLGGHQWGPVYLWIRVPLQLILIGWAYFLCLKARPAILLKPAPTHGG